VSPHVNPNHSLAARRPRDLQTCHAMAIAFRNLLVKQVTNLPPPPRPPSLLGGIVGSGRSDVYGIGVLRHSLGPRRIFPGGEGASRHIDAGIKLNSLTTGTTYAWRVADLDSACIDGNYCLQATEHTHHSRLGPTLLTTKLLTFFCSCPPTPSISSGTSPSEFV
jgi:hypothetical protein